MCKCHREVCITVDVANTGVCFFLGLLGCSANGSYQMAKRDSYGHYTGFGKEGFSYLRPRIEAASMSSLNIRRDG